MEKKQLKGQVSQEQIQAWKNQYGSIYEISANGKVCYLKNADRELVAMSFDMADKDPIGLNESIMASCFIGGCEDFKFNDNDFLAAMPQFGCVIDFGESSLKKY